MYVPAAPGVPLIETPAVEDVVTVKLDESVSVAMVHVKVSEALASPAVTVSLYADPAVASGRLDGVMVTVSGGVLVGAAIVFTGKNFPSRAMTA